MGKYEIFDALYIYDLLWKKYIKNESNNIVIGITIYTILTNISKDLKI